MPLINSKKQQQCTDHFLYFLVLNSAIPVLHAHKNAAFRNHIDFDKFDQNFAIGYIIYYALLFSTILDRTGSKEIGL